MLYELPGSYCLNFVEIHARILLMLNRSCHKKHYLPPTNPPAPFTKWADFSPDLGNLPFTKLYTNAFFCGPQLAQLDWESAKSRATISCTEKLLFFQVALEMWREGIWRQQIPRGLLSVPACREFELLRSHISNKMHSLVCTSTPGAHFHM